MHFQSQELFLDDEAEWAHGRVEVVDVETARWSIWQKPREGFPSQPMSIRLSSFPVQSHVLPPLLLHDAHR